MRLHCEGVEEVVSQPVFQSEVLKVQVVTRLAQFACLNLVVAEGNYMVSSFEVGSIVILTVPDEIFYNLLYCQIIVIYPLV